MVPLSALWMPIVLSAVLVFFAGFVLWMVLPLHRNDYVGLPDEGAVADTLRRGAVAPGQYVIPHAPDPKAMRTPEFQERYATGPVAFIIVAEPGNHMGRSLALFFLYALGVSVVVAYLASRTLSGGAAYLEVFRVAGTVAVLAYATAVLPGAIWWGKRWSATLREAFDGVVFGLLTAGAFAWLWPAG